MLETLFALAENKYFVDLISALHLGSKTTSQKIFASNLLEKVTAEVQKFTVEKIVGKTVIFMEDEWSNVHNDSVISNS